METQDITISIVLALLGIAMIAFGWSIHWTFQPGRQSAYSSKRVEGYRPYQFAALVLAGFGVAALGVVIFKLLRLYVVG